MIKDVDVCAEVTRVLRLEGQAILSCAERLHHENGKGVRKAVELLGAALENGGKIVVTGLGKSGKVAQKIAATLSSTGSLAVFLHPTEGMHGNLGILTPKDAVLALSHTGNTEEIIRLLPSIKNLGVPIIAIGGNRQSQLAQHSDAWIDALVTQEACPHNLAPTASTTLALALGDALAVTLMQVRGFNPDAFARNHPGGSLGKKLHLKVADVMHRGAAVAVIGPEASMDDVVVRTTDKKLGAVLVIDGPKMLGIITDGDIRRALKHREKFFNMKAAEIMTRTPVSVSPEMQAIEALELMENRPSQISVLPVVDSEGNWQGMIRLHDLIQTF